MDSRGHGLGRARRAPPGTPPGVATATRTEGAVMGDKSPRQHQTKAAGKTIKQKRADKRAAADGSHVSVIPPGRTGQ